MYKWAHEYANSFGGDPARMFTTGTSCGAQLALCLCNRVLKDSTLKSSIKGVASLSATTASPKNCPENYRSKATPYQEFLHENLIIDGDGMHFFLEELGVKDDDADFWVLPVTNNHKNFPPVYMTSCEYYPLRDDAKFMLEALREVGVPTKHDFYPGLPHYFWIFPSLPETSEFVDNLVSGVEWLKSQI